MTQRHDASRSEREGLWDWNLVTNRFHVSPRWLSLIGCDEHDIGHTPDGWLTRIHAEDRDRVIAALDTARKGERWELEIPHRLRHRNGSYRWMSCRALVEPDPNGKPMRLTGWHADVTAEEVTDTLTGLPNHKLLEERLTLAIERSQQQPAFYFALLLVDLGLPEGAEPSPQSIEAGLVTAAARRLETCLRTPDSDLGLPHSDLVARRHGDQFGVLLEGLKDVGHATVIADRLLGQLLAPFSPAGDQTFVNASIGIAVSITGYQTTADLIRDAEIALHRARTLGGSKCELFDTAILKSEQVQAGLDTALKDALDRGEFRVFYQPIFSLVSNQIVGFEALVRWQHPTRGLVPPQEFIPLAEKTGFIVPLGQWILREACTQLKGWQNSLSADCWVSVNLSGVQLKHEWLVEEIAEALRDTGLDARNLTLELTESTAMENPVAIKTLLMRLRALGVRISIDDFGTGYSSLAHLRQFPVDTLKVDRSFIRGIETSGDTSAIISALTAMAQQLGLHVVVEGVENEAQLSLLRSLRCDAVQGYLLANPLDAHEATAVLTTKLALQAASAPPSSKGKPFAAIVAWSRMSPPVRRGAMVAAIGVVMLVGLARIWPRREDTSAPTPPEPRVAAASPQPVEPAGEPSTNPLVSEADRGPAVQSAVVPAHEPVADAPRRAAVDAPTIAPAKPSAPVRSTKALAPASFKVIHLHRFGSCDGELTISRDGLVFTPVEHGKDAFTLAHGEFVQSMADDTLTVKSPDKTWRFKAADGDKPDAVTGLRDFAASIARFRSASAAF